MEAVVGCNYLYRRGGTYWFRRRVPDDVQAAIGTPQWRESLRTKDFETAKRAVRRKGVETDGLISTARARLAGKASPPLDTAKAYALAESWLSEVLDSEQDTRIAGGAAGHASTEAWLLEYAADYRRDLALMSLPAAGYAVEKALADAVLWYPENDPSRRLLGIEMLKARVRLIDMLERRLEGEVVDVAAPTLAALTTPPTSGITVGKLIAAFNAERVARHGEESTSRKYSHIFSALEEVLGTDKPVRSVTRADIREVRSLLQRVPKFAPRRYPGLTLTEAADKADEDDGERIAPTTVNTYLQNLAAVFNWAVSEDYIDRSPAQGMKLSADARVQRRGFTPEELDKARARTVWRDDRSGLGWGGSGDSPSLSGPSIWSQATRNLVATRLPILRSLPTMLHAPCTARGPTWPTGTRGPLSSPYRCITNNPRSEEWLD